MRKEVEMPDLWLWSHRCKGQSNIFQEIKIERLDVYLKQMASRHCKSPESKP